MAAVSIVIVLGHGLGRAQSSHSATPPPAAIKPVGVVTRIQAGSLSLHTDAGPELQVQLPDEVTVVRVPPGAKDLKSAAKISVSDIHAGDRVFVRGKESDDQKSVVAASVIVMSKTELESARETERLAWQQRGIGGLVKALNPDTKEITISVPNVPPTPGNPAHPVVIAVAPNATLLRYAPGSVKFSDAKPSTFAEIRMGDQVRALGTKSADGSRYLAEKLVSGSFRNIGATVISVDAANGTVTVKDLATAEPVVVRTNADSQLHRLPEMLAQMIAMFNSGRAPEGDTTGAARPAGAGAVGGPGGPAAARFSGAGQGAGQGSGQGVGQNGAPRDFNRMLERTPALKLGELKPGDAVIVVSTQGANPSEVTAITLLAGVEPILAAQPKGSSPMNLGSWSMGMGGGGGEGEGTP